MVATPIGNLDDITHRAVNVLRDVSLICCEDTRVSAKLAQHFSLCAPLLSFHEHNEAARVTEVLDRLNQGQHVALISDAGTPLVNDPGYRLVRAAIDAHINVVPIPGPSAPLAALAASGLPTDRFSFLGFLPVKQHARRALLESLADAEETVIFFEAPHRIAESLADIADLLPHHPVVLARELTKLHEEFLRGNAAEIAAELARRPVIKGEITLLIGKAPAGAVPVPDADGLRQEIAALEKNGIPRNEAIKQVAKRYGLGKRQVYDVAHGLPSK